MPATMPMDEGVKDPKDAPVRISKIAQFLKNAGAERLAPKRGRPGKNPSRRSGKSVFHDHHCGLQLYAGWVGMDGRDQVGQL